MHKKLIPLFVITLICGFAFACSPATATEPPSLPTVSVTVEATSTVSSQVPRTEAEVPRVSVDDAIAAVQNSEAIVVDVRSAQAFQASHIPGALSIPLFDIESNPAGAGLDKEKWIITYCT